jgi:hypothetical protein
MRTTTASSRGDRAGHDRAHDAQEHSYDNPRRRREHHTDGEDDDRQEQAPTRFALRVRD